MDAFERGAVDALVDCAPKAAIANRDWSISGMLTYLERYNGLKYANAGRPSPYLWSGTTIYDPPSGPGGKVTVDHGPIENVVDKQLGVAGSLLKIDALDDTINFGELPEVSTQPALPEPDRIPTEFVDDAYWLQASLNKLGCTPPLSVDGIIGAATRTAVRAFQESKAEKAGMDSGLFCICRSRRAGTVQEVGNRSGRPVALAGIRHRRALRHCRHILPKLGFDADSDQSFRLPAYSAGFARGHAKRLCGCHWLVDGLPAQTSQQAARTRRSLGKAGCRKPASCRSHRHG
jgi:hypothetical protein